jgi:hypothetical protein
MDIEICLVGMLLGIGLVLASISIAVYLAKLELTDIKQELEKIRKTLEK